MKIVKVIYTTRPEFAEQNQANIKKVMTDLQSLKHPGINYNSCLGADGKTFIHTAFFKSEEDQKLLNELPSSNISRNNLNLVGLKFLPNRNC